MFDGAAGLQDLVGAHGGVADDDQAPVRVVLAQHVPGVETFVLAAAVALPQAFVRAVVEVIDFQIAEFAAGC
ncbi:hypothetical protein D3C78_1476330 [compost metagenome]